MSDTVEVSVDPGVYRPSQHSKQVRPGKWVIRDLKAHFDVDPAKMLSSIRPLGLTPYADDDEIDIAGDERFLAHARTGVHS